MPNRLPDKGFNVEILFQEPVFIAAAQSNKWIRRRKVKLAEVIDEPWTLPPPGDCKRRRARLSCIQQPLFGWLCLAFGWNQLNVSLTNFPFVPDRVVLLRPILIDGTVPHPFKRDLARRQALKLY